MLRLSFGPARVGAGVCPCMRYCRGSSISVLSSSTSFFRQLRILGGVVTSGGELGRRMEGCCSRRSPGVGL